MQILKDWLDKLRKKPQAANQSSVTKSANKQSLDKYSANWFEDRYENVRLQRNLLFFTVLLSMSLVLMLSFYSYKQQLDKAPRPYVIEIEAKTGVPTVIDPATSIAYTANDSVRRYLVWQFVMLREEYQALAFNRNLKALRLFSNQPVFSDFNRTHGTSNPESLVNKSPRSHRWVELKSMIFSDERTSQIRFRVYTRYENGETVVADKVVWMNFQFVNLELSEQDRLINPLGFQVTTYKIDNERI